MVQINLLPDVKLEYIKAKRNKRFVMMISTLVIVISIGLFIIVYGFVYGVQKKHSADLDRDIKKGISTIQSTPELDKILTVQNQLDVLTTNKEGVIGKHEGKPAAVRVLPYIAQLLPTGSKVTQLSADFATQTITVSGFTGGINDTNKLVDTLKFVEYKTKKEKKEEEKSGKAFSQVVLGGYSTDTGNSTFSITMKFDPILFNNTEEVELIVPGIESTRSATEKPNIQFSEQPQNQGGGQ